MWRAALQSSFKMQCLEQEILPCVAASQPMLMKNKQFIADLCFSVFSVDSIFSAAGAFCSLRHQWQSWAVHFIIIVVCTIDLGTCNCFEMAPSDFPVFFTSIMGTFRSMLSFLDFRMAVFIAESSRCIWQAQKSHQPLSVIIRQKKLRGHAAQIMIHTAFYNHLHWLFKLLQYILEPADLITISGDPNKLWFEANFMNVFCDKISMCFFHSIIEKWELYKSLEVKTAMIYFFLYVRDCIYRSPLMCCR